MGQQAEIKVKWAENPEVVDDGNTKQTTKTDVVVEIAGKQRIIDACESFVSSGEDVTLGVSITCPIDNVKAEVSRIIDAIDDIAVGVDGVKVCVNIKHKVPKSG